MGDKKLQWPEKSHIQINTKAGLWRSGGMCSGGEGEGEGIWQGNNSICHVDCGTMASARVHDSVVSSG